MKFKIQNIGGIEDAELELSTGANFLIGSNGAGKTSTLNAIRFYALEGKIPTGGRRRGEKSAIIEGPEGMVDTENSSIKRVNNHERSFLMGDSLPSAQDLYILMTDLTIKDVDPEGVMELSTLWDMKQYISNGKSKSIQPQTYKYTMDEAIDNSSILVHRLMATYITKFAESKGIKVLPIELEKYVGESVAKMEILAESEIWNLLSESMADIAEASLSKGKRVVTELIEENNKKQIAALKADLMIKKDVESGGKIKNGKFINKDGLSSQYFSKGEKYSSLAITKFNVMKKDKEQKIVIMDDFETVSRDKANKIVGKFHKYGIENDVVVIFALARTREDFPRDPKDSSKAKKLPFPVYEIEAGRAKLWV